MLEEKSKIVEMMNEANHLFEGATRQQSMTMGNPTLDNDFKNKQQNIGNSVDDLSNLIKPEYIDIVDSQKNIDNLPYEVKIKM